MEHQGTDEAQVNLSKFFVHTQQSVFNQNTQQYDFFSEFHPAFIDPDAFPLEDAFFQFLSGAPNVNCIAQLTGPVDEGDKRIADGTYGNLMSSDALAWDAERHLYQKLMTNSSYESAYAGFTTFLQAHTNSNVGKFYEVQQKAYEAVALPPALQSEIETAKEEIESLNEQIKSAQASGTLTEEMLEQYFNDRYALSQEVETAMGQYENHRSSKLAEAEATLQGISTSAPYEAYRKAVFDIFIEAQLHQDGVYTAEQITGMQEVAMLCSEEAGMATYIAQGLLPDCERVEIQSYIDACDPELEVEPRSSKPQGPEKLSGTPGKGFSFYPNPTSSRLVLSNHRSVSGIAEVFTFTGQLLKSHPLPKGESFWELGLPSGIYLLKVSFEDGEVNTERLIINR
jgi:hypothetical protein